MLNNFILETANAPGSTTTFNLGGAASGRLSFAGSGFPNGANVFYFMDDGTQAEWGMGVFNTGSPNTLTRTTVLGNTAGTTARLNFTTTTDVYNEVPASQVLYIDSTGTVKLRGAKLDLGAAGNALVNGNPLLRGYLAGMELSRNAGTPNTKLDISLGVAADEVSFAGFISTSGVVTIDATTTGANGLDTGSLANSTWYHVHAIGKTAGTAAGLLSTSLTPTLPSGYTLRRWLGAVKTDGSAHFLAFVQSGDDFEWVTPAVDLISTTLGATPVAVTLSTPPGRRSMARIRMGVVNSGAGATVLATPVEATGDVIALSARSGMVTVQVAGQYTTGFASVLTDTIPNIRLLASASSTSITLTTTGYTNKRGRFG